MHVFVQHPEPDDRVPLYEDLQGFWDMIKLQIDNVDENFAEIDAMSQNGWKEVPRLVVSHFVLVSYCFIGLFTLGWVVRWFESDGVKNCKWTGLRCVMVSGLPLFIKTTPSLKVLFSCA